MNRLNLNQLVEYFNSIGMYENANFFRAYKNDSVVVDGWIEEGFVKYHICGSLDEFLWRNIQSNVTTAMVLERIN
jgi:hypothetical protein